MLSEDSKWRILRAVQGGERVTEVAKMFAINRGSVYDHSKSIQRNRKSGNKNKSKRKKA